MNRAPTAEGANDPSVAMPTSSHVLPTHGGVSGMPAAPDVPAIPRRPSRSHSTKRPVRALALGMIVIIAAVAFLAYQGLSNNLVYYITPSELLAKGASAQGQHFRLGGQVRPHTEQWNPTTRVLRFVLQDPKGHIPVISRGILPPELLRGGMGAVVEGTYRNGVFNATTLMVKHSSTYVAPKPGHVPKPAP